MVKHTETIRLQQLVGLTLKMLMSEYVCSPLGFKSQYQTLR